MATDTTEWICERCRGGNVQHAMWVRLNNNSVLDEYGTWCHGENNWCDDCKDHTRIVPRHGWGLSSQGKVYSVTVELRTTLVVESTSTVAAMERVRNDSDLAHQAFLEALDLHQQDGGLEYEATRIELAGE